MTYDARRLIFRTFIVNYDDPGILDYTRVLWTPEPSSIIIDLWCVPLVQFAGADSATLYIGGDQYFDSILKGQPNLIPLAAAGSDRDFGRIGESESTVTLDSRSSHLVIDSGPGTVTTRSFLGLPAVTGTNGTNVVAQITVVNGPLTAGQLKVYALTADES